MIQCRVPIRSMTRRIGIKMCGCAAPVVSVARERHLGASGGDILKRESVASRCEDAGEGREC